MQPTAHYPSRAYLQTGRTVHDNMPGVLKLDDRGTLIFQRDDGAPVTNIGLSEADKIKIDALGLEVVHHNQRYYFLIGDTYKAYNPFDRQLIRSLIYGEARSSESTAWLKILSSHGFNPTNDLQAHVVIRVAKYVVPIIFLAFLLSWLFS